MFGEFLEQNKYEVAFTLIIAIVLIWYYMCYYSKGKKISDNWSKPTVAVNTSTIVPAKPEEFKNDMRAFVATENPDSMESKLQNSLY